MTDPKPEPEDDERPNPDPENQAYRSRPNPWDHDDRPVKINTGHAARKRRS